MLTSFATIFELSISMVTALLGLAYPLFIDKNNGIAIMSLVTMFANANDKVRPISHRSRGLRAPCREAPPRCFS